jgi:hypothetical protein
MNFIFDLAWLQRQILPELYLASHRQNAAFALTNPDMKRALVAGRRRRPRTVGNQQPNESGQSRGIATGRYR